MKLEELQAIAEKATNGTGDVNDALVLLTEMFASFSKHLKEVKTLLNSVKEGQDALSARLDQIESHTTDWVYRAVVED
ncbi:MAG: hypothetical protein JSS66_05375 [Armatimonadetes bacterium]|nr:hypothetical protein [Armatimonadota bacterium]